MSTQIFGVLTGLLRKSRRPKAIVSPNFSSKRGNKNFYKGKGVKNYGEVNAHGFWEQSVFLDWKMPDLTNFKLKPYVAIGGGLPGKAALLRDAESSPPPNS